MRVKVYLVLEKETDGSETVVAVRLILGAAQAIAGQAPNRRVERWFATKRDKLVPNERGRELEPEEELAV
jgi:hypothetical protein